MEVALKEGDVDVRSAEDIVKITRVRESTQQNQLSFVFFDGVSEPRTTMRVLQGTNILTSELNESVEFIIRYVDVLSGR